MSRFLDDTAVETVGGGRFEGRIDRGWWIVDGPNGGYLAAIVVRAVEAAAGPDPTLRSLTVHYLRRPTEGPVTLDVRAERVGRTVSTWSARVEQPHGTVALALATVAGDRDAVAFDEVRGPAAPSPEDCAAIDGTASMIPMHGRYDMAPCFGRAPWEPADPAAPLPARTGGWLRLSDPTPVDAAVLVAMTDAWWPPVFSKLGGQPLAVPTVDLTVHLHRRPADPTDWVLGEFTSPVAEAGYLVEDARLFDRHGRLLVSSRQLAVVM